MTKIVIEGKKMLSGEIKVAGAKNSVVGLIPASILCGDKVKLTNVPNISDVEALSEILVSLGVDVKRDKINNVMEIDSSKMFNREIPENLSSKLRASYYFMGVLLGKYNRVDMCFPGGCSIGERPINFHLKGFEKLGATVREDDGNFSIVADKLVGNEIFFDVPSVGATINIMLASVLASGKTVIDNAAMEPEVVDIATFLVEMGANIKGIGTPKIEIIGVSELHGVEHAVIPDRLEAGTYVIVASLLGKDLTVSGLIPSHIDSLTSKLEEAGVKLIIGDNFVRVDDIGEYRAVDIITGTYPGYPTDLQQPMIPFLTQCDGISHMEETIYENRFMNIPDTVKMGAKIEVSADNKVATINGKTDFVGQDVIATDLRGGASMVICGLLADGVTTISNVGHILRGYQDIVLKLSNVGAEIKIVD